MVKSIYDDFVNKVLGGRPITLNGYGSTEGALLAIMKRGGEFELGCVGELYAGVEVKVGYWFFYLATPEEFQ